MGIFVINLESPKRHVLLLSPPDNPNYENTGNGVGIISENNATQKNIEDQGTSLTKWKPFSSQGNSQTTALVRYSYERFTHTLWRFSVWLKYIWYNFLDFWTFKLGFK